MSSIKEKIIARIQYMSDEYVKLIKSKNDIDEDSEMLIRKIYLDGAIDAAQEMLKMIDSVNQEQYNLQYNIDNSYIN